MSAEVCMEVLPARGRMPAVVMTGVPPESDAALSRAFLLRIRQWPQSERPSVSSLIVFAYRESLRIQRRMLFQFPRAGLASRTCIGLQGALWKAFKWLQSEESSIRAILEG